MQRGDRLSPGRHRPVVDAVGDETRLALRRRERVQEDALFRRQQAGVGAFVGATGLQACRRAYKRSQGRSTPFSSANHRMINKQEAANA